MKKQEVIMIPDEFSSIRRDGYTFIESNMRDNPNCKGVFDTIYIDSNIDSEKVVEYINSYRILRYMRVL